MRSLALVLLCSITLTLQASNNKSDSPDISEGNGFVRVCSSLYKLDGDKFKITEEDVSNVALCSGYLMGLKDGTVVAFAGGQMFCFPDQGIELGQQVKIVIKYIKANPEKAHLPTAVLATQALQRAFPCKR